jgi:molybdopterin/thiamine biosynthesis adenylyltransferase
MTNFWDCTELRHPEPARSAESKDAMSFSEEEVERYARHLVLREIGGAGQQALKAARVLIIGAGGLGAPAALYLAAAGIGRLGLVDDDEVALSNLQRQVLYGTADVGRVKTEAAAEKLGALNPNVAVDALTKRLTDENARELVRGYDVVLDGSDSFETRFAVGAACLAEGKTLVSGAIGRWTGQVGVFAGRPCYRCFVPEIPPDAETCAAVGVVGALAGVIGSLMALETIKLITGAGEPLTGRLLIFDALAAETRTVRIGADPAWPAGAGCATGCA